MVFNIKVIMAMTIRKFRYDILKFLRSDYHHFECQNNSKLSPDLNVIHLQSVATDSGIPDLELQYLHHRQAYLKRN